MSCRGTAIVESDQFGLCGPSVGSVAVGAPSYTIIFLSLDFNHFSFLILILSDVFIPFISRHRLTLCENAHGNRPDAGWVSLAPASLSGPCAVFQPDGETRAGWSCTVSGLMSCACKCHRIFFIMSFLIIKL